MEKNVSGGINGPQPYPGLSADGQGDGDAVYADIFLPCVNRAPDIIRSYSETIDQAYGGGYIPNYGPNGSGAPLPNMTLGVGDHGWRGMANEPMPAQPVEHDPDGSDDY